MINTADFTRYALNNKQKSVLAFALVVDFTSKRFNLCCFSKYNIFCPEQISRSAQARQAEFFFGRLSAKFALADMGLHGLDVPIGSSGEPVWPSGIVGSISHAASLAAAVALIDSRHQGIGIDIERVIGAAARPALCAVVVNASELAYLQSLTMAIPIDLLLTIAFSAKESFFKAVFGVVRRYFNFHAVAIADLSLGGGTVTLVLHETLADDLCQGQMCEIRFEQIRPDVILSSFIWDRKSV